MSLPETNIAILTICSSAIARLPWAPAAEQPRRGGLRARVLAAAFTAHPERFVAGRPRPPALPTKVWINKPSAPLAEPKCDSEPEVVTNFASRAPYSRSEERRVGKEG